MESEWGCALKGGWQVVQRRIHCTSGKRMSMHHEQNPHLEKSYFDGDVFPFVGARGPSAAG